MFTNVSIIWLILAFMIGMVGLVCARLFSKIHPFRFLEHKASTIGLLFISTITIMTLLESILLSIRISHQVLTLNVAFAMFTFIAFAYGIWIILPDIYSERISLFMYSFFFGIAIFFEVLATVMFYLVWTRS